MPLLEPDDDPDRPPSGERHDPVSPRAGDRSRGDTSGAVPIANPGLSMIFVSGDRVMASRHIGGPLRRRVRRGARGIVVGREVDGRYRVVSADAQLAVVHPDQLTPCNPSASSTD